MISYINTPNNVVPANLEGFFSGWINPPSTEKHLQILQNSAYVVLAIDEISQNVIGFINAISDNIMSAYIPLLEVLPEYQNRGIGTELVKRMMEQLASFYMIDLTCNKDLQPYYEKLGLTPSSGMMKRNYAKQNCL